MIDDKTPNLKIPLPHEDNLLTEDVPRLREAFTALDAHAAQTETGLTNGLAEALAAATDAAKKALWAGIPDKPATFPPATHGHTFAELGDAPATFPPATHGHGWNEVSGKPASFPPAGHNHDAGNITSGTLSTARGGTGRTDGKASALATARTISLSGAASGSVSFDGSASVSLPVTIVDAVKWPTTPSRSTFLSLHKYEPQAQNLKLLIPSGGTWAYFFIGTRPSGQTAAWNHVFSDTYNGNNLTILKAPMVGVVPGGTDLGSIQYGIGFAWRIA